MFIVIGPFCWGKHSDLKTAIANCKENWPKSEGRFNLDRLAFHVSSDPEATVNGMGGITAKRGSIEKAFYFDEEVYTLKDMPLAMIHDALMVQNASNPVGVANSLFEVMKKLNSTMPGHGSDWVGRHPIVSMYLGHLAFLNRTSLHRHADAYKFCETVRDYWKENEDALAEAEAR